MLITTGQRFVSAAYGEVRLLASQVGYTQTQ